MDPRAGREVQATDPRRLRGAGQPLARYGAAVGRWHHRPGADARRARPRLCRNAERADPRPAAVRRVQDVMMLSMLLAVAAQTSSNNLPPAQALPPPTGDEQAVLSSTNALLNAFNSGNSAEILRWVYADGRVTGTGTLPNRTGVRSESWTQFTQRLASTSFQEIISDPAVEVDGDAAMVWAPFVVRVGGKVS